MDRDTKEVIAVILVIAILIFGGVSALFAYSGMDSPLTVVESGSMQHSEDRSMIGVIDTGDIVIMRDTSKCAITTFVEGHESGYQRFGDYGDVIIYNRAHANPVIHRAIVWLDYLGNDKWAAPSLKNYDDWKVTEGNCDSMSGILTIGGLGWRNLSASVNLDGLPRHSGYLTNGDNNSSGNITYFDQATSIARELGLIQKSDLKAVAGLEIPYFGCIKMLVSNINVDQIPVNSIPCLAVVFIDIAAFFIVLAILLELLSSYLDFRKEKKNA